MIECDVIGGKSDGAKIRTSPKIVTTMELKGETYIALSFKLQLEPKSVTSNCWRDVTVYILADTKPSDAIAIWRQRNRV